MPFLDVPGVLGVSGQDGDDRLEGMGGGAAAGVEGGGRTDQFSVEDGAGQLRETGRQVGQVVLLAEPVGDLADAAAGDPDPAFLDVQEGSYSVPLRLHYPGVVISLYLLSLVVGQVGPIAEQHRCDLGRKRPSRMVLIPEVIAKGSDERLLACSPVGLHPDRQGRTFRL